MEHTICAVSSAVGQGGIGIVRMSGDGAIRIGSAAFSPSDPNQRPVHRMMQYGHITDDQGERIDEVLISFMFAPGTYTKEDMVEIYTHGGVMAVRKVYERLLALGCTQAEPGEFTKRAFLNGRIDLTQAEAVMDVVSAKTDASYKMGQAQLEGGLSSLVEPIFQDTKSLLSIVEAAISFSEDTDELPEGLPEKVEDLIEKIDSLLLTKNRGKVLREGISTLIIGKPNVGKSSLFNALMQENRALVTDIPGTTRDTIEEVLQLSGVALRMVDTAGIRETEDVVESMGVERAVQAIDQADLILWVVDSSRPFTEEDERIREKIAGKTGIAVLNKLDLASEPDIEAMKARIGSFVPIPLSAKKGTGLEALTEEILRLFEIGEIDASHDTLLANSRHIQALESARKYLESAHGDLFDGIPLDLIEVDLRLAWTKIGEITGSTVQEDLLDTIFSTFCIGK